MIRLPLWLPRLVITSLVVGETVVGGAVVEMTQVNLPF